MLTGIAKVLPTEKGATITIKVDKDFAEAHKDELKDMHMERIGFILDFSSIQANRDDLLKNIRARLESIESFIESEAQIALVEDAKASMKQEAMMKKPDPTPEPGDGETAADIVKEAADYDASQDPELKGLGDSS
jgi:hypothetical protein